MPNFENPYDGEEPDFEERNDSDQPNEVGALHEVDEEEEIDVEKLINEKTENEESEAMEDNISHLLGENPNGPGRKKTPQFPPYLAMTNARLYSVMYQCPSIFSVNVRPRKDGNQDNFHDAFARRMIDVIGKYENHPFTEDELNPSNNSKIAKIARQCAKFESTCMEYNSAFFYVIVIDGRIVYNIDNARKMLEHSPDENYWFTGLWSAALHHSRKDRENNPVRECIMVQAGIEPVKEDYGDVSDIMELAMQPEGIGLPDEEEKEEK